MEYLTWKLIIIIIIIIKNAKHNTGKVTLLRSHILFGKRYRLQEDEGRQLVKISDITMAIQARIKLEMVKGVKTSLNSVMF